MCHPMWQTEKGKKNLIREHRQLHLEDPKKIVSQELQIRSMHVLAKFLFTV